MKNLSSPLNPNRCPDCNRYGSHRFGGRCKSCFAKMSSMTKNVPFLRQSFESLFGEGFTDKEWHPKEYGMLKNTFGITK